MIKLSNIKQTGDIVSATVETAEIKPKTFEVAINIITKEITKNTLGEMTESSRMAISKLFKQFHDPNSVVPQSSKCTWY